MEFLRRSLSLSWISVNPEAESDEASKDWALDGGAQRIADSDEERRKAPLSGLAIDGGEGLREGEAWRRGF